MIKQVVSSIVKRILIKKIKRIWELRICLKQYPSIDKQLFLDLLITINKTNEKKM